MHFDRDRLSISTVVAVAEMEQISNLAKMARTTASAIHAASFGVGAIHLPRRLDAVYSAS